MAETILLSAINLAKSYAGVRALRNASFELRAGEVHALVGENGAGKSTLIKILTGAVAADSGQILLDGRQIDHNSPRLARVQGVVAIYQQPALFPELTVSENIATGLEHNGLLQKIDWRSRHRRALKLLAEVGADIDPETEAGELSMPQ